MNFEKPEKENNVIDFFAAAQRLRGKTSEESDLREKFIQLFGNHMLEKIEQIPADLSDEAFREALEKIFSESDMYTFE